MSKFYSLSIKNEHVAVLSIQKIKSSYSLLDTTTLKFSELSNFLKNKKSVYVSIDIENIVGEVIAVPSVIKNKSTIYHYILQKLNPDKLLLLNYHKLSIRQGEENVLYYVNGIDEYKYTKVLKEIQDWSSIKGATTTYNALLSLTTTCINNESFISIFTNTNNIVTLAIHKKKIIFSRSNFINVTTPEILQLDMIANIKQTISYIQQQFRDVNFSLIALSGSMKVDDAISQQIYMSNQIPVSTLYPSTLVKNLKPDEAQNHILSIGAFLTKKENQYLPKSLLGVHQFKFVTTILLYLSSFFLVLSLFNTVQLYSNYHTLCKKYHTIKNKLLQTLKKTQTLPDETLQKSLMHLKITREHLDFHPYDATLTLKPLIELIKPIQYDWTYQEEELKIEVVFEKSFTTLLALHNFEQTFNSIFKKINTNSQFINIPAVDYRKLFYSTTIKTKNQQAVSDQSKERVQ